jgi:iron complex transport system substrate-binding protein
MAWPILLMAGLAACAPQSADHAAGPLKDGRPRLMSMSPCIDAILLRVADPDQIVSISHYSHDPASSSVDVNLARGFPANHETAEEVVMTHPDIVLASLHVAPATQAAIQSSGIEIAMINVPNTFEESREQVRAVARAAGHPERGEALIARIDDAVARARPPRGSRPVTALIREDEGLVPGTGTLADDLLRRTGFHNMSADYGLAMWDMLPLEVMVSRPPQVVLSDLGQRSDRRRLPTTIDERNFPVRLLHCAGPNLIEAADRLARIRRAVAGA